MLTGKKAFEGKSHASLIGAIMHAEPAAIARTQPFTPPALDRIFNSSKGIVYESGIDRNNLDVWILSVDGNRKPHPVIREPGNQGEAKVSPDGRWIAYTNEEPAGRPEVFVQSLMTAGAKWRVSTGGGRWPLWRHGGKELFYLAADGSLIAVPIEADATALRPGVAKALFRTDLSFIGGAGSFGASSDGQRFVIRTAGDSDERASIVVVSNWLAAMKSR